MKLTRKGFLSTVAAIFGAAPVISKEAGKEAVRPITKVAVGPSSAYAYTAMPARAVSACFMFTPTAEELSRYKAAARTEAV